MAVAAAVGTLTLSGQPLDTETVVVGGKTYTFLATVGTTDGNVHIGADAEESIKNLYAAINLDVSAGETGVAGTDYAAATTRNNQVKATSKTATTLVVTALQDGEAGNNIPSTETLTNGAWGAATLASGAGAGSTATVAELEALRTESGFGVCAGVLTKCHEWEAGL